MLVLKLALYALVFIAGFSFIQVLFAFLLLYLESSLNTHITKPITSKPTTVKMVGLFFFEWIFKLFLKLVSYPILFLNSKAKHVAHSKSCIILLHGYSRNAVDWLWFKKHLQANGKDIMALTLPLVTRDLQTSAKDLSAELHKLKAQHGYEEFILIGHSMGGVIASLAVETSPHLKEIVSKVIALGSPFHGTKISVFGVGFTATQLLPNSSVLNNLRSLMTISNTDYYCVVTNCDHMILPWDSAIVDNISYDVVEDIGHLQLIYSKVVLELVEANINLNQGTINNECLDSDKDASFN